MVQWYSTYQQEKWLDNASSDTSSQAIKCTASQFIQAYTSCLWVAQLEET